MLINLLRYFFQLYLGYEYNLDIKIRSIFSFFTAFSISLIIGKCIINYFKKNNFKQIIRENYLQSHVYKKNTPTMGGVIILISLVISIFLWSNLSNLYVWYVLFILFSYSIIGLIDDYKKIYLKNYKGLSALYKYFYLSIVAVIVIIHMFFVNNENIVYVHVIIPFLYNKIINIGLWCIPLIYFVLVGTSNAVNLTDGLDGLAIVPIILISIGLSIISWITGDLYFSEIFSAPYIANGIELLVICMSIIGSGLGFLWFNAYPSQIFMGDVGALSLGGVLGVISILLCQEFLLFVMGSIFVLEAISVILQVLVYKIFFFRIFYIAPIHHHYEKKGIFETHIVIRFWIISFILVIIGIMMFLQVL